MLLLVIGYERECSWKMQMLMGDAFLNEEQTA